MKGRRQKSGQAMLEYVLVFAALLTLYFAARYFYRATRTAAVQTSEIVSSDSP